MDTMGIGSPQCPNAAETCATGLGGKKVADPQLDISRVLMCSNRRRVLRRRRSDA